MALNSGFTILKKYEVLYREAIVSRRFHREGVIGPVYAIPLGDDPVPPAGTPRYRGLNRDRLHPVYPDTPEWYVSMVEPEAETLGASRVLGKFLDALDPESNSGIEWLTSIEDAQLVWQQIGSRRHEFEIVFARKHLDATTVPQGARFLGCDPADPYPGGFSCICDALFFPVWHGTDPEGILFAEHFARLNEHGLFSTHDESFDYLHYYLSFDWTERSHLFTSMEIYAFDMPSLQ